MSSTNSNSVQTPEPKRAVIACLVCRGKKTKCIVENGETRCKLCIKSNVEHCIFAPVHIEQETKITQSSQGPYTTSQFRVERATDYANHLPNAQPTQSSVHSWSIYNGNALPPPPPQRAPPSQRAPPPQRAPVPQPPQQPPHQTAPTYQGTATIRPHYETYQPPGQYGTYPHHQSQLQPTAEMYAFVENAYPGSWVQPSNYPNQGTTFPGQFSNPQQSMATPASSSMPPPYGNTDPNMSWSGNASTNFYYPERNNDEQRPFDGQGSF